MVQENGEGSIGFDFHFFSSFFFCDSGMGKSSPFNFQGFPWKGGKIGNISGRLCKLDQVNSEKIPNVLA